MIRRFNRIFANNYVPTNLTDQDISMNLKNILVNIINQEKNSQDYILFCLFVFNDLNLLLQQLQYVTESSPKYDQSISNFMRNLSVRDLQILRNKHFEHVVGSFSDKQELEWLIRGCKNYSPSFNCIKKGTDIRNYLLKLLKSSNNSTATELYNWIINKKCEKTFDQENVLSMLGTGIINKPICSKQENVDVGSISCEKEYNEFINIINNVDQNTPSDVLITLSDKFGNIVFNSDKVDIQGYKCVEKFMKGINLVLLNELKQSIKNKKIDMGYFSPLITNIVCLQLCIIYCSRKKCKDIKNIIDNFLDNIITSLKSIQNYIQNETYVEVSSEFPSVNKTNITQIIFDIEKLREIKNNQELILGVNKLLDNNLLVTSNGFKIIPNMLNQQQNIIIKEDKNIYEEYDTPINVIIVLLLFIVIIVGVYS